MNYKKYYVLKESIFHRKNINLSNYWNLNILETFICFLEQITLYNSIAQLQCDFKLHKQLEILQKNFTNAYFLHGFITRVERHDLIKDITNFWGNISIIGCLVIKYSSCVYLFISIFVVYQTFIYNQLLHVTPFPIRSYSDSSFLFGWIDYSVISLASIII